MIGDSVRLSIYCPYSRDCLKPIEVGVVSPTILHRHETVNSRWRHAIYNHLRSRHPGLSDRERTLLADRVLRENLS